MRTKETVKKPWYKRWQVWLGILFAIGVIGRFMPNEDGEANTRGQMFMGRGSADKIYVYFVNSKGEHLVDTKHLDYGWTAK